MWYITSFKRTCSFDVYLYFVILEFGIWSYLFIYSFFLFYPFLLSELFIPNVIIVSSVYTPEYGLRIVNR